MLSGKVLKATKKPRCEVHRGWEDTGFNRYERLVGVVLSLLEGALREGMKFWMGSFFIRNVIGRALLSLGFDCVRSLHERGICCQVGVLVGGNTYLGKDSAQVDSFLRINFRQRMILDKALQLFF